MPPHTSSLEPGLHLPTNISQQTPANVSADRSSIPKRRGRGPGTNNIINNLNTTPEHTFGLPMPVMSTEIFAAFSGMNAGKIPLLQGQECNVLKPNMNSIAPRSLVILQLVAS
ncbi:hypothetical protein ACET3Z_010196 [Daucus carota]